MRLDKKLPLVVIFGRTNVGKSTLFNCLTEKKNALVADIEGTTRDSNIGEVNWNGYQFELADTGGIMDVKFMRGQKKTAEIIEERVQQQARDYVSRADLLLFVVDAKAGLLPTDREMALELKKMLPDSKKIILVSNKTDNPRLRRELYEFNQLALGEPVAISATTGSGTGDLLDLLIEKIKKLPTKRKKASQAADANEEIRDTVKVCVIGKPNVGKSSLVNSILGEERCIVSSVPHTTREPQDTIINYKDEYITLIDTAGISKQGKKGARSAKNKNTLDKFSIKKSVSVIGRSDVALLVVDIQEGLTLQESKLVEEVLANKTSLIIIANKWDLVEDKDTKHYTNFIYDHLPYVTYAPIQFTSALTGAKVGKILSLILEVSKQRKIEISDNALGKHLSKFIKKHAPAKGKGTKHPYVHELTQTSTNPPKFKIRIGSKDNLHFSYVRFIENRLREKFGFIGTPITIYVEKNRKVHGKHEHYNV